MNAHDTTVTPVELEPLKRYEMDPDRVEVRTSVETADLRVEITVEGHRNTVARLLRVAERGLDSALRVGNLA